VDPSGFEPLTFASLGQGPIVLWTKCNALTSA